MRPSPRSDSSPRRSRSRTRRNSSNSSRRRHSHSQSRRSSSSSPRDSSPSRHDSSPRRGSSPSRRGSSLSRRGSSPSRRDSSPSRRDSSPDVAAHPATHRVLVDTSRTKMQESNIDYRAALLALQASNKLEAQKKRKRAPQVSLQSKGRSIRMLVALFGEISHIVAAAESYLKDGQHSDDDDFDQFTPHLTPEKWEYVTQKRDVRTSLRDGSATFNESFWCRIFYLNFQGDLNDVNNGFLQSRYLVKAYKIVFTGPASAKDMEDENTAPKKAKLSARRSVRKAPCEIFNMDGNVTPRSLAYICVLLHMSLTNVDKWATEVYGFSYPQMYNFMRDDEKNGSGTRPLPSSVRDSHY
ncbi:Alpha beta-hydrolase [Mycena sanguinolenta]|uniref:Alpha beta-hydrolase n=1 Tax=Mycena sanguinolenta TaxID=230812 RepID=A0A8H7CM66_9AGAR|nr:Alpha beta-hydrolase [Mycena sanguinolenta]